MQTIQLDIAEDKLDIFLTIISNLKDDMIKGIRLSQETSHKQLLELVKRYELDIEPIEKDSADYREIMDIKSQNNIKYSLEEARAKLGL